jgi:hypothetical protein
MAILRGERPIGPSPTAPTHVPAAPETADRSTAWIWLAIPVTTAWRRRVGLGMPTQAQNACHWGGLGVHVADALTRVACGEPGHMAGGAAIAAGISRPRPCAKRPPQENRLRQGSETVSHP